MIILVEGVPGSGKSYFAVYLTYMFFGLEEKHKKNKVYTKWDFKPENYKNGLLTNVNELKPEKFQENCITLLNWKSFVASITVLHNLYTEEASDTELLEEAEKLDFNPCNRFIFLDEAQDYLDKENKVLVWWFTYHRHLYMDIVITTQNHSLINPKYKKIVQTCLKVKSSTMKLDQSKMIYTEYPNVRFSEKDKIGKIVVPAIPAIFEAYKSGAVTKGQSVVKKFLMLAGVLLIALIIMFYFILNVVFSSSEEETEIDQIPEKQKRYEKPVDFGGLQVLTVFCSGESGICLYDGREAPRSLFYQYVKSKDIKIMSMQRYLGDYFELSVKSSKLEEIFGKKVVPVENNTSKRSFSFFG